MLKKVKQIDWASYIWLIYLPYTLIEYLPVKTAKDIFWISMVGFFTLTYILVNEVVKYRMITITFELLITGAFAYFSFNFYLIIFPAWQVAFILARYPRRYYRIFATSYYLIIAVSFFVYKWFIPIYGNKMICWV